MKLSKDVTEVGGAMRRGARDRGGMRGGGGGRERERERERERSRVVSPDLSKDWLTLKRLVFKDPRQEGSLTTRGHICSLSRCS